MNNDASTKKTLSLEPVGIGERQTRVSTVLVILLCMIPAITTILFGGVDSITWTLLSVLSFASVVLWSIETWRARGLLLNTSALMLPLVAIVLLGLVQLTFGTTLNPFGTKMFLVRIAFLALYFAACLTFVNTEKRLRRIIVFLVIFGALMGFVGILQRLADPDTIYGLRTPFQAIPFGPFVNQHHFAVFMEMTGGVALGLVLGSIKPDKKVLAGLALAIMLIALILTGSRGGMLSFVVLTGVCLVVRSLVRGKSDGAVKEEPGLLGGKLTIIAGSAAVVVGVLGAIIFIGGDESLLRGIGLSQGADTSNGRLHFWSIALRAFADHPILGVGLDGYGLAFPRYDTWSGLFRVENAHNDYLQALADGGLVGLGIVIAFLFLFFRNALKRIRSSKAGLRRDVAIGALAGCCGVLVHSLFDFPLRTWSNAFFFLLLATIATVWVRPEGEKVVVRKRRKRRSSEREPGSPSSHTAVRT